MNKESFEKFEEELKKAGYRKYRGAITNNDYYYAKGFAYYEDEDGERHPSYQIIYSVWDYNNYPQVPDFGKIGLEARVMLHDNGRTDLILTRDKYNIKEIEYKAEKFFAFAKVYL